MIFPAERMSDAETEQTLFDCSTPIPEGYSRASIIINTAFGASLLITGEGVPAMVWIDGGWQRFTGSKCDG